MSDDLVKRLRGWDHCWPARWLEQAVAEAADRIKALEAENSRLRGLVAYLAGENEDHVRVALGGNPNVVAEIMDRARAALTGGKE